MLLAAAVVAVLVAGVPAATAGARSPTGLGEGDDLDWMTALEANVDDHLVDDQLVELEYGSPERLPGDVANVFAWGDSGLWTGTYLAAQSFRFAVAEHHLAEHIGSTRYWRDQRDAALARVERIVDKYHLLVNIAEDWQTELNPELMPNEVSPVGFGGGVVEGQKGMLMRACARTTNPPSHDMEPNKRVFGPFDWQGEQWWCETAPSRDTYAGTTFGLLTAYDLVGDALGGRRDQIRADILALASFLVKHGWTYPRPHGNVSIPEVMDGHDFDNFISPLFVYVPLARLNMAQAARHVARGTDDEARWEQVYAEEVRTQEPMLQASLAFDAADPHVAYYKFNLHHLTGYNLVRLEPDDALRGRYMAALAAMDETTGDDGNAHFETITYALSGEPARLELALRHLREWQDYRVRVDGGGDPRNSDRCGTEIECVPRDQREIDGVVVPGTESRLRAKRPIEVARRPGSDFIWQREPVKLDGFVSSTHQAPGVDYLLPYWMLRFHTEVAPGAVAGPFPPYAGPAHS